MDALDISDKGYQIDDFDKDYMMGSILIKHHHLGYIIGSPALTLITHKKISSPINCSSAFGLC